MRIAIVGAGGVGGCFGAALARAGVDVTFIARGKHLEAMKSTGLRVESPLGNTHLQPTQATDDPRSVGPVDYVIFCVKLWDVESAGEQIKPMVAADTAVIPLQNGIDAPERLAAILGEDVVMGGVANISATIAEPGVIRQTGTAFRMMFGELDGKKRQRGEAFAALCQKAGIDGVHSDAILTELWMKFILLATNASTMAMIRQPLGKIRDDADIVALMRAGYQETVDVGRARGVRIPEDAVDKTLAWNRSAPAGLLPSMAVDLMRGNRIELPWLSRARWSSSASSSACRRRRTASCSPRSSPTSWARPRSTLVIPSEASDPWATERSLSSLAMKEVRKIIHVDMDAFYASVEQRDNPGLRGKPVAVGGSRLRGVVAAASYEARKFGVRSAMPSLTAKNKCPELIFVKPRFDVYKAISKQIREIFHEYTPLVEPLSLDEAYLDVTHNLKGIEYATRVAREIRARILEETALTASAGISYNKFLAKLGSDQNKPNGQCTITPDRGEAFVGELPVGRFHGVGPVTAARMNKLGLFTGADLRARSIEFLTEHFGKSGPYYHAIARGLDDRRVNPDRIRKSVGSETTFFEDLHRLREVEDKVKEQFDEVWSYCAKAGMKGRTVTVKIKYNDFQIITRSKSDATPFADRAVVERHCLDLVRGIFPLEKPIRLLGVTISNFDHVVEHDDEPQLPLI